MSTKQPSCTGRTLVAAMAAALLGAIVLSLAPSLRPAGAQSAAPPNDAFAAARTINVPAPGQAPTITGDTSGATMEAGEPRPYHPDRDCDGSGVGGSVWYKINPTRDGTLTVTTEGSSFDTVLALYRGTSMSSLTQSNCSDANNAPNRTERMSTAVKTGRTYYVQLSGTGATRTGKFVLGASLRFFGPGNWPSFIWRPFSDSGPFNKRLPANPTLAANSAQIVNRITNSRANGGISPADRPAHLVVHTDGSSGEPNYYSRPEDPIYWTQPDAHLTVVDQAAAKTYELWQVHTNPIPTQGGHLYFSWGGLSDFNGRGLASDELKKDQNGNPVPGAVVGDATAARTSSLSGRVRAEEFAAGKISHALAIGFDCDNGSSCTRPGSPEGPARNSGSPTSTRRPWARASS